VEVMSQQRRYLFLDLDCFFVACEILCDRSLRDLPFAVGGSPHQRGVVSSASYPARAFGVRSAMPMSRAIRLCPSLRIIPPHFDEYRCRSDAVMAYLRSVSLLCEQRSIDEAVLDITDIPAGEREVALGIQQTIRERFHLPCSLGVANGITIAKIATETGKQQSCPGKVPQALTVVPAGEECAFLAPLLVEVMPGIGPKLTLSLKSMGIHTLGDLAAWPLHDLVRRVGGYGLTLQRCAQGFDTSSIELHPRRRAISQEHTFAEDCADPAVLRERLLRQATQVSQELHHKGCYARVVKIKLRAADFTTLTRQLTLSLPSDQAEVVREAALRLFQQEWNGEPLRLIGVGVQGLQTVRQLTLWEETSPLPGSRSPMRCGMGCRVSWVALSAAHSRG
jgi:DNA polymerase-4